MFDFYEMYGGKVGVIGGCLVVGVYDGYCCVFVEFV